jgi:hypothetical protein
LTEHGLIGSISKYENVFYFTLGSKARIVFLLAKGELTWQSNLVQNQLQNQLANLINVGVTTKKRQEIHLPSSRTITKKAIKVGGVHLKVPT